MYPSGQTQPRNEFQCCTGLLRPAPLLPFHPLRWAEGAYLTQPIREVAATIDGQDSAELNPEGPAEVVLDNGYHSNDVLVVMVQMDMRAYCSEPDRGRRNWIDNADEKAAVYANRRRIRGERGKRLLRQHGEQVEHSFAHLYETGRMRRTHLRHHANILKRLLTHASAFNLGLLMRKICGSGTPRRFRDRLSAFRNAFLFVPLRRPCRLHNPSSSEPDYGRNALQ